MTPDRYDYLMDMWVQHMHAGAAVDACVEDLRHDWHNHYLALHCKYLAGVWRFPRLDQLALTIEAQDMLRVVMVRRGLGD